MKKYYIKYGFRGSNKTFHSKEYGVNIQNAKRKFKDRFPNAVAITITKHRTPD